jgi:raffinose/stachyose/melibiose transport system permease protein
MNGRTGSAAGKIIPFILMLIIALLAICPFAALVWRFFTGGASLFNAWKPGNFGVLLLNSFLYSAAAALVSVMLGLMAGFGLSKFRLKINSVLYAFFAFGIFCALQPILVPLFLGVKAAGWYNTRLGVLIPYLGLGLPLGVCLGAEFIRSIPDAIVESARLDGASWFRIFGSIILPMAAPAAALIGALVFTITWNEFLVVSVLTGIPGAASLAPGLAALGEAGAPALVMGLLPSALIFLFFRKQFIRAAGLISSNPVN